MTFFGSALAIKKWDEEVANHIAACFLAHHNNERYFVREHMASAIMGILIKGKQGSQRLQLITQRLEKENTPDAAHKISIPLNTLAVSSATLNQTNPELMACINDWMQSPDPAKASAMLTLFLKNALTSATRDECSQKKGIMGNALLATLIALDDSAEKCRALVTSCEVVMEEIRNKMKLLEKDYHEASYERTLQPSYSRCPHYRDDCGCEGPNYKEGLGGRELKGEGGKRAELDLLIDAEMLKHHALRYLVYRLTEPFKQLERFSDTNNEDYSARFANALQELTDLCSNQPRLIIRLSQ